MVLNENRAEWLLCTTHRQRLPMYLSIDLLIERSCSSKILPATEQYALSVSFPPCKADLFLFPQTYTRFDSGILKCWRDVSWQTFGGNAW